jgi:hypothetical protein
MPGVLDPLRRLLCCSPPARVTGVVAEPGGGSGEVFVVWSPLTGAAFYRVYRRVALEVWRPLAAVTPAATDPGFPGKVAFLDFVGWFPGGGSGGDEDAGGLRHYVVTAVGTTGLEGPWSVEVSAGPPSAGPP